MNDIVRTDNHRGGRRSRDKGNRAERAIVRFLQERGLAAERIPLSGSAGGKFRGDVSIPLLSVDRVAEVKCRANGFRELYAWLDARDLLIVKADRREPLVVIPLKLAAEIAQTAERGKLLNPQFATSAAKRDTAAPVPACDAKPCTERKSIQ
jgi:Holliday junction resolvase